MTAAAAPAMTSRVIAEAMAHTLAAALSSASSASMSYAIAKTAGRWIRLDRPRRGCREIATRRPSSAYVPTKGSPPDVTSTT